MSENLSDQVAVKSFNIFKIFFPSRSYIMKKYCSPTLAWISLLENKLGFVSDNQSWKLKSIYTQERTVRFPINMPHNRN